MIGEGEKKVGRGNAQGGRAGRGKRRGRKSPPWSFLKVGAYRGLSNLLLPSPGGIAIRRICLFVGRFIC